MLQDCLSPCMTSQMILFVAPLSFNIVKDISATEVSQLLLLPNGN